MTGPVDADAQALIWNFYKPRHTHAWNMLALSWKALESLDSAADAGFEVEYLWENFIIRLWLYRTTVRTLTKLAVVRGEAETALIAFDDAFSVSGKHGLKAIRDMIEHFDDYAAGIGRGPAERDKHLDPWRVISKEEYRRGDLTLDRAKSFAAAVKLRDNANVASSKFIGWFNAERP